MRNAERGDQFWRKNGSRRSLRTWITTVMARSTTLSSSLLSPEFMRLDACIENFFLQRFEIFEVWMKELFHLHPVDVSECE